MILRKKYLLSSIIFVVIVFLYRSLKPGIPLQTGPKPIETVTLSPTPTVLAVATESGSLCHINGVLPDSMCTPGAVDPAVTKENIDKTICVSGYTAGVRPKVTYTNKLKIEQIKEYGYSDTNPKDYEEDHLISLELGGHPSDPKNLWPEPGASPNSKDKIENICHQKVCDREITLEEAQRQIATDWTTACQ